MTRSPGRILVAALADSEAYDPREVELLFRTLRLFGGALRGVDAVAHFVGSPSATLAERLSALDVGVKVVARVNPQVPHSNKIAMLEEADAYDYLVALDTDTVVVRDFSEQITGSAVCAKPVDHDWLSLAQWHRLFSHFGLETPKSRYLTSLDMRETIPYFNSGVLILPGALVPALRAAWESFVAALLDAYPSLPDIAQYAFHTDQYALALAIAAAGVPYRALPLEMNFPTHLAVHPATRPETLIPYLLHHHHRLGDDGNVMHCSYPGINALIDALNARAALSVQPDGPLEASPPPATSFDNRCFWDRRYSTNPALGSGIGSRGQGRLMKRELISSVVAQYNPRSVLDVGCGDLEVIPDLSSEIEYTGIDVSEIIVQRNSALRSQWTFLAGNFVSLGPDRDLHADLVVCLDVLIHQHDRNTYLEFVRSLVRAVSRVGLISGYESLPRAQYRSEITAFHEPLTQTLRAAGAVSMEFVATYRDTAVITFLPGHG